MKEKKTLLSELEETGRRMQELERRGYVLLSPSLPKVFGSGRGSLRDLYGLDKSDRAMDSYMQSGGEMIDRHMFACDNENIIKCTVPATDASGNAIGTPGKGYIKWGVDDRLPLHVYRSANSNPYTAAGLRFLTDCTMGLGPQNMYVTYRYDGGTASEVAIPYEHADTYILGEIARIRKAISDRKKAAADAALPQDSARSGTPAAARGVEPDFCDYRIAREPERLSPAASIDHEVLGSLESQLQTLYDDYDTWLETSEELGEFNEQNNLTEVYQMYVTDDSHLDMATLLFGVEQGRVGTWNPKIKEVRAIPSTCVRLEEMDENMRINYIYFSDVFMYSRNNLTLTSDNIVAYPLLRNIGEFRRYVEENQKSRPADRRTWFALLSTYPCGFSGYYQQPAWWSVYTSLIYQYVSTLFYDKAIARNNSTMFSHLLYINNNYLQQLFQDQGATTPEEKNSLRDAVVEKIDRFLANRMNNGKNCSLDSFIGPDGKSIIKSIEVVEVPRPAGNTATREDIEQCARLLLWPLGVHDSLIGAMGSSTLSGGTAQRELYLLKDVQMSARRKKFTDSINSMYRYNGWDKHLECRIGRVVLTTLDNSKTGLVEE